MTPLLIQVPVDGTKKKPFGICESTCNIQRSTGTNNTRNSNMETPCFSWRDQGLKTVGHTGTRWAISTGKHSTTGSLLCRVYYQADDEQRDADQQRNDEAVQQRKTAVAAVVGGHFLGRQRRRSGRRRHRRPLRRRDASDAAAADAAAGHQRSRRQVARRRRDARHGRRIPRLKYRHSSVLESLLIFLESIATRQISLVARC